MSKLPYVTAPGSITKAFTAIRNASVPDRVSQDFVKTILKIAGGSGNQITSFLKKLDFADTSGKPTEIYTKFRNNTTSGIAMADAIRHGYSALYARNEFMHELNDAELMELILEETGEARDSNPAKLTLSCLNNLKEFADFSADEHLLPGAAKATEAVPPPAVGTSEPRVGAVKQMGLNLGYNINLNLPATSDPAVFDAIFKSLKENLLREDDG